MAVVYYEGERIYFRPIEPDDEPTLRRWVNDPRVWSTLGFRPPINAHRERRWIEQFSDNGEYIFGITLKAGDRMIGTTGLHRVSPVDRKATFGILIGEAELRNRGYGTEATRLILRFGFEELNLHRVELCVFDFNPGAIRAYEKAGFECEGRFRDAVYRHGRYHDELRYAILRDRWERLHAEGAPAAENLLSAEAG